LMGIVIYFSVSHLLVSRLSKTKSEVNSQRNTRLLTEHPTPPSKYSNVNLLIPITMVTLSREFDFYKKSSIIKPTTNEQEAIRGTVADPEVPTCS